MLVYQRVPSVSTFPRLQQVGRKKVRHETSIRSGLFEATDNALTSDVWGLSRTAPQNLMLEKIMFPVYPLYKKGFGMGS